MTGDGVNDAPALKKADVGIAVEGATDAACAAADIVLTEPGLATIIVAIKLSRCIFQRLKNYLTYRVASSLTLALFFLVSASAFNPQAYLGCVPTNGALPAHVAGEVCRLERVGDGSQIVVDMRGVAIPNFFLLSILQLVFIVIFNDLCMITVAWDNVRPSRSPKRSGPASARTLALPPAPHPNPHPHTHASPSPKPEPGPHLGPNQVGPASPLLALRRHVPRGHHGAAALPGDRLLRDAPRRAAARAAQPLLVPGAACAAAVLRDGDHGLRLPLVGRPPHLPLRASLAFPSPFIPNP